MSAREDYAKLHANTSGPHHQGQTSRQAQEALDEIDRLRVRSEAEQVVIDRALAIAYAVDNAVVRSDKVKLPGDAGNNGYAEFANTLLRRLRAVGGES